MVMRDFLNLALNREKTSRDLYVDLLGTYKNLVKDSPELKELFLFLIQEKTKYIELIEHELARLESTATSHQV